MLGNLGREVGSEYVGGWILLVSSVLVVGWRIKF